MARLLGHGLNGGQRGHAASGQRQQHETHEDPVQKLRIRLSRIRFH